MIQRKTLFFTVIFAVIFGATLAIMRHITIYTSDEETAVAPTKYGAYLAAQHAIYVNDFESAAKFANVFSDIKYPAVKRARDLTEFLGGKLPTDVAGLEKDKNPASRFIYDAYLVQNGKWNDLYNRYRAKESAITVPLRIWSGIATKHEKEVLKYIDGLKSNSSWKSFIRGQIYAEKGDIERATKEFADVDPAFMNLNDYMYIMSFYTANSKVYNAQQLRQAFTSASGGMFMSDYDKIPEFALYSGIKNQLAFNLVQNVSHTKVMLYSDLSVLMLRLAQTIGPETDFFQDMYNYYLGQFFANTRGNYAKYFDAIDDNSPFFLFAQMHRAGDNISISELKNILRHQPLFIPALNKLVAKYTAKGDKRDALRVINRALGNDRLSDSGRVYLMKKRATVYLVFGDLNNAQSDIRKVAKMSDIYPEVLAIQARIWAAQGREIENAYGYAMKMVMNDPTDIVAWDTLGVVVGVREGNDAALEILERVGATANTCSALFEHLGDAYIRAGKFELARGAYMRAMELSDDGLSVVPKIQKKIQKIK